MWRNFVKLLTGNGLSQGIQFVALYFLAILYVPDNFGVLGHVQALSSVIAIFVTLQLQHVIPLSKGSTAAQRHTTQVFQIAVLLLVVLLPVAICLHERNYLLALLMSFSTAVTALMSNYSVYKGAFGLLSGMYVFRAVAIVCMQVVFYFISLPEGLLYGALLGEALSGIVFVVATRAFFIVDFRIRVGHLWHFVKRWRAYSVYGTLQEFLSVMVYSLPMILYVEKFGDNIGGQYSIAYRLIWAPTVLVSSSLAQLLTHRFGREGDFSFLKRVIWFDKRVLIAAPLLFLTLFALKGVEGALFQGKWHVTVLLLPYMYVNAVFFLYANPFRVALRVKRLNVIILFVETLTLLLIGAAFLFFEVDVVVFTMIITGISLLQNGLIVACYFVYCENKKRRALAKIDKKEASD